MNEYVFIYFKVFNVFNVYESVHRKNIYIFIKKLCPD
jgi:hypothetical protein